jgi:hypothetical protein
VLIYSERRDGLIEHVAEIRVHTIAPVSCPPSGVYGQLSEVGEASGLRNTG